VLAVEPEEQEKTTITRASLLRDRIIFYLSLVLIVLGGLYFALGSYLHDLLHIPVVGTAFTIFGPVNVLYALVGAAILFLGLVLFFVSLRGGTLSREEAEQIIVEGESS
jgi:hypothetical protein